MFILFNLNSEHTSKSRPFDSCCDCIQWVMLLGPNQLEQCCTSSDCFICSQSEEIIIRSLDGNSLPVHHRIHQVSVQPVDFAVGWVGHITTITGFEADRLHPCKGEHGRDITN